MTRWEKLGQQSGANVCSEFHRERKCGNHTFFHTSLIERQGLYPLDPMAALGSMAAWPVEYNGCDTVPFSLPNSRCLQRLPPFEDTEISKLDDHSYFKWILPISNRFSLIVAFLLGKSIRWQQKNLKLQCEQSLTSKYQSEMKLEDFWNNSAGQWEKKGLHF